MTLDHIEVHLAQSVGFMLLSQKTPAFPSGAPGVVRLSLVEIKPDTKPPAAALRNEGHCV
jgi:hypothetical protein